MKVRELEVCEIQHWYPRFKVVSLKTIFHPLPESFIAYLQEDGLFLPRDSDALPSRPKGECEDEHYQRWDEEYDEADEPKSPSFPELEAAVASSIAKLDGSVFPKLNWSAPKDSAWISSRGNLKCTNFGEVCLLLKASDSLVHDLCHAYDCCEDKILHRPRQFFLALRKWYDMRPEMEFRGFVRQGLLVGVSQREVTSFYPALVESQETLDASIFQFFLESLSEVFELEDYTFDCYVTKAGKVKLLDFNPWGAFTLPLLFTWEELEDTYAKFAGAYVKEYDVDSMPFIDDSHESSDMRSNGGTVSSAGGSNDDFSTSLEVSTQQELSNACPDCGKHTAVDVASNVDGYRKAIGNTEFGVVNHSKDAYNIECIAALAGMKYGLSVVGRKRMNIVLREQGFRSEFRIVQSDCHVKVNLRMGGGVPYDYVQTGPGSPWDEFLRKASEELQQQNKDAAAGG